VVLREDDPRRRGSPRPSTPTVVVFILAALVLVPGVLGRTQESADARGTIRGRVEVRRETPDEGARPSVTALGMPAPRGSPDRRASVVYLESAPRGAFEVPPPGRAALDQRDETFVPHVLAVTVGTTVDFPNSDRVYHNVFSLSKTKRFDLGRYPRGASRSVRFDQPGVVRVFCEIHSHMSAFVLVFAHRYFAITDAAGRYRIDAVPPGRYTLAVWNEGEVRQTRPVVVPEEGGVVEQSFVVE
jgi:Carboxypeptidase regulatory-like domain